MESNYKFFQNNKCEYFPCHKIDNQKEFNCLFCYCPLYALKDKCGGNFIYTKGIKDCSKCSIPHVDNGYEHIMSKIGQIIKLASKDNINLDKKNDL
ncbi:Zn-finger-like domain-containing protein [Desulfonispora thiosulfatigenes DSM 11270]|uniref:Zn-finger-like domain-containing protein n=1 Tax=Desulfonispora thiosulfatigenes DSM 11270 TaxID=656914 RepID=A0A1W1VS34_DESTI|nr:cysteine-rich small domain-containing protein [Desulfonispora thiosulfatigenes]SMB96167.1 Zn-finger-like domain-containing protein [Desulfonispora thiosulfatigenes DSM 11270]